MYKYWKKHKTIYFKKIKQWYKTNLSERDVSIDYKKYLKLFCKNNYMKLPSAMTLTYA